MPVEIPIEYIPLILSRAVVFHIVCVDRPSLNKKRRGTQSRSPLPLA